MSNDDGCDRFGPQPSARTVRNQTNPAVPEFFFCGDANPTVVTHKIGCRNITCDPQDLRSLRGKDLLSKRWVPRLGTWIALVAFVSPALAGSQVYSGVGNIHEVFVGSETEQYLRYLSLDDSTSSESWLIRPLSPVQVRLLARALGTHPWQTHLAGFADSSPVFEATLLSPGASIRFNSAFPYGSNDGAIWAGRGLTFAAQGGLYARLGPLSLTLLPTAFRAENAAFRIAPSTLACGCGDLLYGTEVDKPQRFGRQPYQRLDPGQSSIRLDGLGVSAGLSTAHEGWGPSTEYPFLLGNNAPGFPHVFLRSSSPFPVLIGRAHMEVIYGRLDQSSFSPVTGSKFYSSRLEIGRVRFASGLIATFQPRGLDGLEVGVLASFTRYGLVVEFRRRISGSPSRRFLNHTSRATTSNRSLAPTTSSLPFSRDGLSRSLGSRFTASTRVTIIASTCAILSRSPITSAPIPWVSPRRWEGPLAHSACCVLS